MLIIDCNITDKVLRFTRHLFTRLVVRINVRECSRLINVRECSRLINVRECSRGNQIRIIQRNWQHRVNKALKNKIKIQNNICWTPLYANKHK